MGQRAPHVISTKTGESFDWQYLADGEVTGGNVFTVRLYSSSRLDWYPRLAQGLTRASSTAAMAGGGMTISGNGGLA